MTRASGLRRRRRPAPGSGNRRGEPVADVDESDHPGGGAVAFGDRGRHFQHGAHVGAAARRSAWGWTSASASLSGDASITSSGTRRSESSVAAACSRSNGCRAVARATSSGRHGCPSFSGWKAATRSVTAWRGRSARVPGVGAERAVAVDQGCGGSGLGMGDRAEQQQVVAAFDRLGRARRPASSALRPGGAGRGRCQSTPANRLLPRRANARARSSCAWLEDVDAEPPGRQDPG